MQPIVWGQTVLVGAHNNPLLVREASAMSKHPADDIGSLHGDQCNWEDRSDLGLQVGLRGMPLRQTYQ